LWSECLVQGRTNKILKENYCRKLPCLIYSQKLAKSNLYQLNMTVKHRDP